MNTIIWHGINFLIEDERTLLSPYDPKSYPYRKSHKMRIGSKGKYEYSGLKKLASPHGGYHPEKKFNIWVKI